MPLRACLRGIHTTRPKCSWIMYKILHPYAKLPASCSLTMCISLRDSTTSYACLWRLSAHPIQCLSCVCNMCAPTLTALQCMQQQTAAARLTDPSDCVILSGQGVARERTHTAYGTSKHSPGSVRYVCAQRQHDEAQCLPPANIHICAKVLWHSGCSLRANAGAVQVKSDCFRPSDSRWFT